jgi:hypothetical protein
MKIKKSILLLIIVTSYFFLGWGRTGHQIINRNSTLSFNEEINFMVSWADFLAAHGSDADDRKGTDPTEGPKHYIDIDAFPEFISSGSIHQNFDSLVAQHGLSFVEEQGVLPWAILNTIESLKTAFENGDWENAKLLASDLGHYVGDAHMPLHITLNYNGQLTNQYGVHSRYESTMINNNSSSLQFGGDSLIYIENPSDYVFQFIYTNYTYVDSVLQADSDSRALAGSYNGTYYEELWDRTEHFTKVLFKSASNKLANLIYTTWVNAGSPVLTNIDDSDKPTQCFLLEQNYPNPFNPSTKIKFTIPNVADAFNASSTNVLLKIYDILGNEITTLVNEQKSAGNYEVEFSSESVNRQIPSGVYLYKLQINDLGNSSGIVQTKKMLLVK